MVWERVAGIKPKLPVLTAAEQTKLSWARAIKTYDQVPEAYRSFFETLAGENSEFPYAVLTLSYAGFFTRAKEKLVCCLDGNITVLEEALAILSLPVTPLGTSATSKWGPFSFNRGSRYAA